MKSILYICTQREEVRREFFQVGVLGEDSPQGKNDFVYGMVP